MTESTSPAKDPPDAPAEDQTSSVPSLSVREQPFWQRLLLMLLAVVIGAAVGVWSLASFLENRERTEQLSLQKEASEKALGPGAPPSPKTFYPIRVLERQDIVRGWDVLSREQANKTLQPRELVIGLTINGESRAYPLNVLHDPEREIFNDKLGGKEIAATWCHLCNTPIVFDRKLEDRTVTLGVSGLLWETNLVMYDKETGSLWSQAIGEAMRGPLVGKKLKVIPATLTDWRSWARRKQDTTVAFLPRTTARHSSNFNSYDQGLVVSVTYLGKTKAWPIDTLSDSSLVPDTIGKTPVVITHHRPSFSFNVFLTKVGETPVELSVDKDHLIDKKTGTRWDVLTGDPVSGPLKSALTALPAIMSDAAVWSLYHPDGEVAGMGDMATGGGGIGGIDAPPDPVAAAKAAAQEAGKLKNFDDKKLAPKGEKP